MVHNIIPASLFGLRKIKSAREFRDSISTAVTAGPSFDGNNLVFYSVETNGAPADQTGIFRGVVTGTP